MPNSAQIRQSRPITQTGHDAHQILTQGTAGKYAGMYCADIPLYRARTKELISEALSTTQTPALSKGTGSRTKTEMLSTEGSASVGKKNSGWGDRWTLPSPPTSFRLNSAANQRSSQPSYQKPQPGRRNTPRPRPTAAQVSTSHTYGN